MIDVLVVFGTRPELLKLAPVVSALRERGLSVGVVATGQHLSLLDMPTLAAVGDVPTLGIESDGSVLKFTNRAKKALRAYMTRWAPRAVVVQGDTMSAYAGALAASELDIPIAHVEAGLRSGNLDDPWPEEAIRVAITRVATWHYAPTEHAAENVLRERVGPKMRNTDVLWVGNTSMDALRASGVTSRTEAAPTVLVTLHRRELRQRADIGDVLGALSNAIASTPHVRALWPVHPAMYDLVAEVRWPPNITTCQPLPHAMMLGALAEARGVLTDSGGVVEEAAALGVPTAMLRNVTDRPEAEAAGIAVRFPVAPVGATLAWNALASCSVARVPSDCFGDGHAAEYIARHLATVLK